MLGAFTQKCAALLFEVDKLLARDPHTSEGSIALGGRALTDNTVTRTCTSIVSSSTACSPRPRRAGSGATGSIVGRARFPPDLQTAAALGAHHKAEIEKWRPLIKTAGIKSE